jgi:hypothetical protein
MRGLRRVADERIRLSGALIVFLLLACRNKDPGKTARSWNATLQLVAKHKVSRTYVKQIVDVAQDELSKLPQDNADVKAALDAAKKLK